MFGTVVSDGEPLRVRLSEKVVLEEDMLIRTSRHRHERGTHLILLRDHGGQRWYVLEVPGHTELSGLDDENCHPIVAITGLRGELDNHNGRLVQIETVRLPDIETRRLPALENNRVPALEHDMNDSDGKVALLTKRVKDLEDKMDELWSWYQIHKDNGQEGG